MKCEPKDHPKDSDINHALSSKFGSSKEGCMRGVVVLKLSELPYKCTREKNTKVEAENLFI